MDHHQLIFRCRCSLARKAMEYLDIELAIRVYRELKDAAMVLALTDLLHIGAPCVYPSLCSDQCAFAEDKFLLAGHICLLTKDYSKAQNLFLASTAPKTALQMRRDLLHWSVHCSGLRIEPHCVLRDRDQALTLAANLAPEEIPSICREFAQQLEVKGSLLCLDQVFSS